MAETGNFKLSPDEKALLAKLSRNVTNKIKRVEKNYGAKLANQLQREFQIVPPDMIPSQKEFTRLRKKYESFTDPKNRNYQFVKNQHGVVANKAYLDEITQNVKRAQEISKEVRDRFKGVNIIQAGKETHITVEMQKMLMAKPDRGFGGVKDFNFDEIETERTLKRRYETAKERSKEAYYEEGLVRLQDNYIRSLEGSFNSDAQDVVDILRQMSPDDFYEIYSIYDEISFELVDSEGAFSGANEEILNRIRLYVTDFVKGRTDMSLKGF